MRVCVHTHALEGMNLHHIMEVQEMSHHLSKSNKGSSAKVGGLPVSLGCIGVPGDFCAVIIVSDCCNDIVSQAQ